jgi:hypothetical protein
MQLLLKIAVRANASKVAAKRRWKAVQMTSVYLLDSKDMGNYFTSITR